MSARILFRRLLPVALLALGLLVIAPDARAQAELPQARQALADGRYGEAVTLLTTALERDRSNATLWTLRGQAYEGRRQFADAARDFETALSLRPGSAEAQAGLERARRNQSAGSGTALDAYRRQVESNPNNAGARLQYAEALREAGRPAEAATQYEAYLSRAQGAPDVVSRYLGVLAETGRNDRGAAEAQRYLNLYPSSDDLWMRLGYFRLWQGQYGTAQEAFQRALALNARNSQAAAGLEQSRSRVATAPRPTPSAPAPTAELDRLAQRLAADPTPDDRFAYVEELLRLDRAVEAFGELQQMEAAYGSTTRWRALAARTDRALPEDAPVYRLDRLRYRLDANPDDLALRYELVDAYAEANRYSEALVALRAGAQTFGAADDARYQQRLRRLEEQRLSYARDAFASLTGRLARNPQDVEAGRELAALYPTLYTFGDLEGRDLADAFRLYERLLQADPSDDATRYHYAALLVQTEHSATALEQTERLLRTTPSARHYALYTYAALQQSRLPGDAAETVAQGLDAHPDDAGLLLAATTFYAGRPEPSSDDLDRAERYLARAEAAGADTRDVTARTEAIQRGRDYQILVAARRAAAEGRYREAARTIERYAETTGTELPVETRIEMAELTLRAGERDRAVRLLRETEPLATTPETRYAVARLYYDAGRRAEALALTDRVLAERPGDAYALALRGDALRETGRRAEAREAYAQGLAVADSPAERRFLTERVEFLDRTSGFGARASLLVGPRFDFVYAGGDNVEYTRFSPGVDVQFALPAAIPAVLTAGAQLHRISGTDLVVPDLAQAVDPFGALEGRIGAAVDLTPPDELLPFTGNYTNRLTAEVGVFHVASFTNAVTGADDSNTQLQYQARYWHQTPGVFRGSVGVRQAAGARELWTAIGPSVDLLLFQLDIEASAAPVDSLLKISGRLFLNRVTNEQVLIDPDGGPFGFTGARAANHGIGFDAKVGVRIWGDLYAGGLFTRLRYDQPSRLYFAPSDTPYEVYEAFLEYETGGRGQQPYLRVMGALGTVAFSDGFITRRVEADLIYPVQPGLGFGANLRAGQSSRAFAGGDFSSYTTFVASAALYIGL